MRTFNWMKSQRLQVKGEGKSLEDGPTEHSCTEGLERWEKGAKETEVGWWRPLRRTDARGAPAWQQPWPGSLMVYVPLSSFLTEAQASSSEYSCLSFEFSLLLVCHENQVCFVSLSHHPGPPFCLFNLIWQAVCILCIITEPCRTPLWHLP